MGRLRRMRDWRLGLAGLAGTIVLAVAFTGDALACACCANQGERFEGGRKLEAYEKEEMAKVRLAPDAHLSLNEAGYDDVKGILDPSNEYKVTLEKSQSRWVFSFTDGKGRSGRLSFPAPSSARFFEIDPRIGFDPAEKPPARIVTVWLYKEWRFEHPLAAAGFFSTDKDARMTLILHGRGNHCLSSDDFTHWTIVVRGKATRYTLYGELLSSSAQE